MKRRCYPNNRRYILLVAFGVGLLVASFLPPKCLIAVLAITVIILGITCYKGR